MENKTTPDFTGSQFSAIQNIYNYFNEKLFDNKLSNCLLNFSRKSKAYGFFAPKRWNAIEGESVIHEISLNPEHLLRGHEAVISTLVHEMAHLWQQDHGKPSNGYHNKQWAQKMKDIGLYPSNTGKEGGKETGKNCSHYIIKGGSFETLFNEMPKEYLYPLICVAENSGKGKPSKNKTKYTCPSCESNIWGKDGLFVECQDCEEIFIKAA